MKHSKTLLALVCATSLTFAGDAFAGGRNPGSLLIYPVHRSGPQMFSIVCVTNTNLAPATPVSLGGGTNVHFEYVNVVRGSSPYYPSHCVIFDRTEYLTPADMLCVLTACHNAAGSPAPSQGGTSFGNEGYLVVTAEDPTLYRTPWSFNWLIGSELVLSGSGVAYSTEAISFSSPVAARAATDLNGNSKKDFDGMEYEGVPDTLMIDSVIPVTGSSLTLINLTGGDRDINTVYFSVWNDNEYALSTLVAFNCWFDAPLAAVSPLFTQQFLRSVPNDPGELDLSCRGVGSLETAWASLDSIDVSQPGGASISSDGAFLGAITAGPFSMVSGGRLLWESEARQTNGSFYTR